MLSEFLFGKKEQTKPYDIQQGQRPRQQNHDQPQQESQWSQDQGFKSGAPRGRGRGRGYPTQYQTVSTSRDEQPHQRGGFRGRQQEEGMEREGSQQNQRRFTDSRGGYRGRSDQQMSLEKQEFQQGYLQENEQFRGRKPRGGTFQQRGKQRSQSSDQQEPEQDSFRKRGGNQQYEFRSRGSYSQKGDDDQIRYQPRGRGGERGRGNDRGRGKNRGYSGSVSQGRSRGDQDQFESSRSQRMEPEDKFRKPQSHRKDQESQEEWEDEKPVKVLRVPNSTSELKQQEQISGRFYRDVKPTDKSILKDPILDEQERSLTTSSRPKLSNGAFRMVNFEIRKNDPSIPRNACQPTSRDQDGKRVVGVQYEDKKKTTSLRTQPQNIKILKDQKVNFEEPLPKKKQEITKSTQIQEKLRQLKNKISKPQEIVTPKYFPEESESGEINETVYEDDTDQKSLSQAIESELTQIKDLMLIDDKITQDELTVQSKLQFDQIFEVDFETREFKQQFAITAFFRSNQGKADQSLRSVKGLSMAMNYIIDNILSSDQVSKQRIFRKVWKTEEEKLTFLDIFQYADDRIRTIQNDLTKLNAHINISGKMIPILEKIVRFYIVSLFQFYYMKYYENHEGASLTQIDGGITKSTKSIDESLSSLFECFIQQFDQINAALSHLQRRKTSNKSDKEMYANNLYQKISLDYVQKKYQIEFSNNYSEFISYLYLTHLIKPQQKDISRDTNMRINEINAKLCQSCPFYGKIIQTQELHLVNIFQHCVLTRNFRKMSDLIQTSGQSFHQKFLISLFFFKNFKSFDNLVQTFQKSENFNMFEYSLNFEECLYIIQNEFFALTKHPRKLYTNSSGYPSEFSLKSFLLSKVRKQVVSVVPKQIIEKVQDIPRKEVVVVKPTPPADTLRKLEIAQNKWKKLSKRLWYKSAIKDFFNPIEDALEDIEIQLFQRLTLKKGFYQWKKFYESRKKDRWFSKLLEFQPVTPIDIEISQLNDISINKQQFFQQKQKQNILYQIVERCAANCLININLKLCFVFSVGLDSQFDNEYYQFVDILINSLLQTNQHKGVLNQLMKKGTLESRKTLNYTTEDGVQASLKILFQFTQSQYLLEKQILLHGCDQLFIIGSDSLQKDKLFIEQLTFQFGQSTIPLNSTIILPIYSTDQYVDGKNSEEESITLSSVIKEVNESQVHNKQELLIPLGLMNQEGQSIVFDTVRAIFFKLDRVYMYFNIFENQKFKKNFLHQINTTFIKKKRDEIPKETEVVSLSQVFSNIIKLINQTVNDDLFIEAFQNQSIKSLITVCNFAEKCLEDVYETHLKEMLGNNGSNTILNRIPYDMQLNPKDQKKFVRACQGKQLKRTRKIMMLLNPANYITSKIIKTIKNTLSNINGVDILNLVRKNMKLCDRICKQNNSMSVNYASYQRLLQNRFQFGNPDKNYLEGDWISLALWILKDTKFQLKKSGVYFILPKDYVFTIDKEKLIQQIDEDNRNFIRDFKVIKTGLSLQGSSDRTDELFDLNFESYLKRVKGNDHTAFIKQVIQID